MKKLISKALLLATTLTITGCALIHTDDTTKTGKSLNTVHLSQLKPHKTTYTEVINLFGEPAITKSSKDKTIKTIRYTFTEKKKGAYAIPLILFKHNETTITETASFTFVNDKLFYLQSL